MTYELQRLWQDGDQLVIHPSCGAYARKGAINGQHTIQGTALALLDELGAVGGLGRDELGEAGEGIPFFSGGSTAAAESVRQVI